MVGVGGNFIILYGILSKTVMRTARNYFIVILALSDLVLCVVTMPLTLWDILRYAYNSNTNIVSCPEVAELKMPVFIR
jgi:hypothetical protein